MIAIVSRACARASMPASSASRIIATKSSGRADRIMDACWRDRNQISNQPSPIADLRISFCTILIDSSVRQIYKDVAKGYPQIGDWRWLIA
jgi:hypothetical protein